MSFKNLAFMMSSSVLDGSAAAVAASGFFIPANIATVSFSMMAGPTSLAIAATLKGDLSKRITVALSAGLLATLAIVLAAGVGPFLFQFINFQLFSVFAGISILFIALMVMGIPIPSLLPLATILVGSALSIIWR